MITEKEFMEFVIETYEKHQIKEWWTSFVADWLTDFGLIAANVSYRDFPTDDCLRFYKLSHRGYELAISINRDNNAFVNISVQDKTTYIAKGKIKAYQYDGTYSHYKKLIKYFNFDTDKYEAFLNSFIGEYIDEDYVHICMENDWIVVIDGKGIMFTDKEFNLLFKKE